MLKNTLLDYDGSSVFVKYAGEGAESIIFIHGNIMSGDVWDAQLSASSLNKKFKLFAIDLPGCGESQWIENDVANYSPKKLSSIPNLLIQKFNIEKYILVGISYGTNILGEIVPPLPNCRGIVLVSPCIVNETFPASEIILPIENGHIMTASNPGNEELRKFLLNVVNNEDRAELFVNMFRKNDPAFREQLGKALMEGNLTDELKNIEQWKVPVCVVYGKNDNLIRVSYLEKFSALWEERIFFINDAGHMVNMEQPEKFNNLLLSYAEDVFK